MPTKLEILLCILGCVVFQIAGLSSLWLRVFNHDCHWFVRCVCDLIFVILACWLYSQFCHYSQALLSHDSTTLPFINPSLNSVDNYTSSQSNVHTYTAASSEETASSPQFSSVHSVENGYQSQSSAQSSAEDRVDDAGWKKQSSTPRYPYLSGYYRNVELQPSGGWNGNDASDIPEIPEQHRVTKKVATKPDMNFRPSSGFNNLGEQLQLSRHDLDVIYDYTPSAYTPDLPTFDGKMENYGEFRRDLLPVLPLIPPRSRLYMLRKSLLTVEAKRVIEDFVKTDQETLCKALAALDSAFDDVEENSYRLLQDIGKLVQKDPTSDENFVSITSDVSSLYKQLGKINPQLLLEPYRYNPSLNELAEMWATHVPDDIWDDIAEHKGKDRKWLTFEKILSLCNQYAQAVKNTRTLTKKRVEVFGAHEKDVFCKAFSKEAKDVEVTSSKPEHNPAILCCFCNSKEHHSSACEAELSTELKSSLFYKAGVVRCFLCIEEGHMVQDCPLIRLNLKAPSQCKSCTAKLPHSAIICDIVSSKPVK